jgi:Flp pilus assembly protein TadB
MPYGMRAQVTRESDLRSLERRSMYSIFAPLDPDERLPRELLLEGRRGRSVGRRELAGILWLPALCLVLFVSAWAKLDALAAVAMIGATFGGLCAFAMSGERHR